MYARIIKFLTLASLVLGSATLSAETTIKLYVSSMSEDVAALGFSVDGKEYGGMGKMYSKGGLPSGAVYDFGVRVGGVFGQSVSCGSRKISTSSSVRLSYKDGHCSVSVSRRP